MSFLCWQYYDEEIAKIAQKYAQVCPDGHDTNDQRKVPGECDQLDPTLNMLWKHSSIKQKLYKVKQRTSEKQPIFISEILHLHAVSDTFTNSFNNKLKIAVTSHGLFDTFMKCMICYWFYMRFSWERMIMGQ